MKNFIAIDWGKSKVGTAFGDDERRIAFSGELFAHDQNIYEQIASFADAHEASAIVIGYSHHKEHSDHTDEIHNFAQKLAEKNGYKIILVDEILTTRRAHENLKQVHKSNIASRDDVESARVILQDYLDYL